MIRYIVVYLWTIPEMFDKLKGKNDGANILGEYRRDWTQTSYCGRLGTKCLVATEWFGHRTSFSEIWRKLLGGYGA